MPEVQRVMTQSRTEAVVQNLAAYISVAGVKVGDRLPAERDLAQSLGVSRPILREALRYLAALGVIEAKTGSGTYLQKEVSPHDQHIVMSLEAERKSLMQVLELRRALEVEAAALVATRATGADITRLERLVDALEEEYHARGNNPESDKAFHLALYEISGNPLFLQLMNSLWDIMERFWKQPLGKEDFARRTLPMHRVILERIRDRDAEGARVAVRQLLEIVEEDLRD